MDYWFSVSTPANTHKRDAIETPMQVTEGIVTHVWIKHPPGCHGVAHAAISDGLHQLWPSNAEESYAGDSEPMEFSEVYEVRKPAKFYLHTWNLSTSYPHIVYVRITILPKNLALPYLVMRDFVNIFKKLTGI